MLNDKTRKFLQEVLDDSDAARIRNAKSSAANIVGYLQNRGFSNNDIIKFLAWATGVFAGIDGTIQRREHQIFEDVFGFGTSYDAFFNAVKNYNSADERELDEVVDTWPEDQKLALVVYGICVMAHDGKLTGAELDYIERLLD